MNKKKILVFGDLILDIFTYGRFVKISPEANIPVLDTENKSFINLGGAGNVCANINSLGGESYLLSVFGSNNVSKKVNDILKKKGIINLSKRVHDFNISKKERIFNELQPLVRIDNDTKLKLQDFQIKQIIQIINKNIKKFDAIIISDYNKGVCKTKIIRHLIKNSNKLNIPVFVDPRSTMQNLKDYTNCFCIKPNFQEAKQFNKSLLNNTNSILYTAGKISEKVNSKYVIMTNGKKGAFLYKNKKEYKVLKVIPKKTFDVTGAGDTFIAALVIFYLIFQNITKACMKANLAASVAVNYLGTYAVKKKQLY